MTQENDIKDLLIDKIRDEQYAAPADAVARWHETIDRAAARERGRDGARQDSGRKRWQWGHLFWGFALTAALVGGISIGMLIEKPGDTNQQETQFAQGQTEQRENGGFSVTPAAFTRGLQQHLRHSQSTITNLSNNAESTLLVLQLIEQNRLFETVAEKNDAPHLARVLRAFEPILLELASTDTAPESAQALRAQLEFELTVMLTKMRQQSSEQQQTT